MNNSVFHRDFIDLLTGRRTSHMGMHFYEDHDGRRGDQSMSGVKLWQDLADNEPTYNIARDDIALLRRSMDSIALRIPVGLNLIDLGPGAEESIRAKSMRIVEAIQATGYQPVDGSSVFAARAAQIAKGLYPSIEVTPTVDDAFSMKSDASRPSLTYFGGSTIGNLIHPVSLSFPENLLSDALRDLARHNAAGWTLLSFDTTQDALALERTYCNKRSKDFICNIMYRAASQLDMDGFNPDFFESTPRWIKECHLWASFLTATRDQTFTLAGESFHVSKGQEFHVLNSYKFPPGLFKKAAAQAGLRIEYFTMDTSGTVLVLLRNMAASLGDMEMAA